MVPLLETVALLPVRDIDQPPEPVGRDTPAPDATWTMRLSSGLEKLGKIGLGSPEHVTSTPDCTHAA